MPSPTSSSPVAERRRRRAALAAVALLALAGRAAAAPCASSDECLRVLATAQAETRTLDARFTQTKHVSLLDEPLVSSGRFRFRAPDHVRLDIETPQPATILIAGRAIHIPGLPEGEQRALAASPMAALFGQLGALMAGNLATPPADVHVAAQGSTDGIAVTLTPTTAAGQRVFQTMVLRFAGPPPTIRWMRLDDTLGDHLEVELHEVRRNIELPDAVFAAP